jgi:hypothetical protein
MLNFTNKWLFPGILWVIVCSQCYSATQRQGKSRKTWPGTAPWAAAHEGGRQMPGVRQEGRCVLQGTSGQLQGSGHWQILRHETRALTMRPSTPCPSPGRPRRCWRGGSARAQLSSPMPGVKPAQKSAAPRTRAGGALPPWAFRPVPAPGVHSPDSPYAPLAPRAGCRALVGTDEREDQGRKEPHPAGLRGGAAAAEPEVPSASRGFMLPLDPGEKQTPFPAEFRCR